MQRVIFHLWNIVARNNLIGAMGFPSGEWMSEGYSKHRREFVSTNKILQLFLVVVDSDPKTPLSESPGRIIFLLRGSGKT